MEKFNLKWNDFQSNASKSFGLFRNEKYLQDITLVSEDMNHVKAHKLVLSACSEYFRNVLQQIEMGSKTIGGHDVEAPVGLSYGCYEGTFRSNTTESTVGKIHFPGWRIQVM